MSDTAHKPGRGERGLRAYFAGRPDGRRRQESVQIRCGHCSKPLTKVVLVDDRARPLKDGGPQRWRLEGLAAWDDRVDGAESNPVWHFRCRTRCPGSKGVRVRPERLDAAVRAEGPGGSLILGVTL